MVVEVFNVESFDFVSLLLTLHMLDMLLILCLSTLSEMFPLIDIFLNVKEEHQKRC